MELEVPYDPQRIAILDMASLDILDALGVAGGRVVGSADTSLDYLQSYVTDENTANLGTIKTADLEAVMAAQPDVIFIGGRLAKSYDALSEIAPVVYLATDSELGVVESVRQNAATIASMFGLEDKVDELMAGFDARIQTLADFAADKAAIVGMCTSGGFNVLGNDGRCSIIGREIGFENIGVDADIDTSTHGNEASFEFVVEKNPDYIFVMDRDAAIQTDGPARPGNHGERAGHGNRCLQERQYRLSGPPRRMVHRRGRHHRSGHYAPGSGERAAGLSPANNRKWRDTHGYPATSSSSLPAVPCYNGLS